MNTLDRYKKFRLETEEKYKNILSIKCPYFNNKEIIFTSEGFNHLIYSDGRERKKDLQILKFNLFNLAPDIISRSGTLQEYRKQFCKYGKRKANGFFNTKEMEFWGFVAIVKSRNEYIKVKVVLRRVGNGNIIFWSVMPSSNLKIKDTYQLASKDIINE